MVEGDDKTSDFYSGSTMGVDFEEPFNRSLHSRKKSKITEFVIKCSGGYIKRERTVLYIVFVFFSISVIFSLHLFFGGNDISRDESSAFINKPGFLTK